jgi:hypothetical protein
MAFQQTEGGFLPSDSLENSEENIRVKVAETGDSVCIKGVQPFIEARGISRRQ